jgi:hypothetical protein
LSPFFQFKIHFDSSPLRQLQQLYTSSAETVSVNYKLLVVKENNNSAFILSHSIEIRLGEWDKSTDLDCTGIPDDLDCVTEPVQDIPIQYIVHHQNWNTETNSDDIALIRMQTPARYNLYVRPICLPYTTDLRSFNLMNGKYLIVSGWGLTDNGESTRQ